MGYVASPFASIRRTLLRLMMGRGRGIDKQVENKIMELRGFRDDHLEVGKYLLTAANGYQYPFDLLAYAVLNRSLALVLGFTDLIKSPNFIAAAPLLRLQLDNCLRFYAGYLVSDLHDFALKILSGKAVKDQKSKDGNTLTDNYLCRKISSEYPWVLDVYKNTSGYIHLSEKHIFHSVRSLNEGKGIKISIGETDRFVTTDLYLEVIEAFKTTTEMVLRYVYSWAYTKDIAFADPDWKDHLRNANNPKNSINRRRRHHDKWLSPRPNEFKEKKMA